jgi:hypothetical protein
VKEFQSEEFIQVDIWGKGILGRKEAKTKM